MHAFGQRADAAFQLLDFLRQQFQLTGILVTEFLFGRFRCSHRLGIGDRLRSRHRFWRRPAALTQGIAVAAHVFFDAAVPAEHQAGRGDGIDEVPVMADQQQGAGVIVQQLFEQFEGFHIQIVGRLVHHQHIRGLREQFGQQQAVALAAGQPRDRCARPLRTEQEILQIAQHMLA